MSQGAAPAAGHAGRVLDQMERHAVIECVPCGFKHLHPIPTSAELDAFYDREYFQHARPDVLDEDQREVEHRNIFFDQRLDFFDAHAPGRRLFDVGCGDGLFMARAAARGWTVEGVEPSGHAASIGRDRGLSIMHGTLESFAAGSPGTFDVVHLRNVLEHVRDPLETTAICRSLLAPGGILYLEVPNDYEPSQRFGAWLLGERRSWIAIPDHVNYFSFASLERLTRRFGFVPLRRDTTFPMYLFLCVGLNFIRDKALGKRLHQARMRFELFWSARGLNSVRHAAYRLLARCGLGRTAILYARKPAA